jgi:RNA polymerase sigma-70 factor (ECF subfamily)
MKGWTPAIPLAPSEMSVACDPAPSVEGDAAPSGALTLAGVYRVHAPQVARWAAHLGGPWVDVEDIVQDVFLIVRRRLDEFRGDAKVTTWLYRITARVVSDARRKERLRSWLRRSRRGEVERALLSAAPTPAEQLERVQARATVHLILDRLPEKYRTVLVLFELEGLSGEDVSAMTGVKLATVWVHLHRARALFVAEMEAHDRRRA